MPSSPDDGFSFLESVASEESERRERAWAVMTEELVRYARTQTVGDNPVQAQAVSVVQSVLKDFLGDPPGLKDEAHFVGHLKTRVRHKLLQRLDRRKRDNKNQRFGSRAETIEPEKPGGPSPASELVAEEEQRFRADVAGLLLDTLGDALRPEELALLRARVVDGRTWEQIASEFGSTAGAMRTRWCRLQKRVRVVISAGQTS